MTTDAYDRVTHRLVQVTGYQARGRGEWKCPSHDDGTASLSVSRGNEGVIFNCHAGCSPESVCAALDLKMSDLFDQPKTNGTEQPTDVYPYVDEHGTLLFEVVRFPGKKFRQRRPDGKGGYEWNLGNTRRVLFHLPQLIDAVNSGQTVYVCEGEKDVLAIERAGGAATCNPHGAGKWRPEYSDYLKGAHVVIVRDQDPPGIKHAADVEASLGGKAARVRVVDPYTGKDAFDHLAAGFTLDDWLRLPPERRLQRSLIGQLVRTGVPEPATVHQWLYAGGLHTIQSEPGVGKSWLALWLCVELVNEGWSVMYMDEEGGQELVAERLAALGADPDLIDERFHYYPFPGRTWSPEDVEALRESIGEAQRNAPLAVGVLDSLPDFLASADLSENDAKEVTGFVHRLLGPFRDAGAALVVLDHLVKPADPAYTNAASKKRRSRYSRGSGAKLAKAHLTILVEADPEFDRHKNGRLKLWATKDRRGFIPLPRLSEHPLELLVNVGDGSLRIEVNTDTGASPGWEGPTRCMDAVLHVLKLNPNVHHSISKIEDKLRQNQRGYQHGVVSDAAAHLAKTVRGVQFNNGPRGAIEYWWNPDEGMF